MTDHLNLDSRGSDVRASTAWGLLVAGLLILGIYAGSHGFRNFDPALVSYAGASVFAGFGIGYRYAMWLRRPPTRLYWVRGWQFFLAPRRLPANLLRLLGLIWDNFFLQKFIERRSRMRWAAHWLIAWGCLLAAAVTFPLSFGWIRFETARDDQSVYEAFVFGLRVMTFPLDSFLAPLTFNILVISAVMVIAGVGLALWRRATDGGALAVQQFASDLLPLVLLFAISVTGLLLSASVHFMRGSYYHFLSQFHAVTVIVTLVYLPFGKFFHIFQRPANFGVSYYRQAGAAGEQARCLRCGDRFASRLQVEDLKTVEAALGIRYGFPDGAHYQDVCPPCRRKSLALTQDGIRAAVRRGGTHQGEPETAALSGAVTETRREEREQRISRQDRRE
jgi:hypothetical protein